MNLIKINCNCGSELIAPEHMAFIFSEKQGEKTRYAIGGLFTQRYIEIGENDYKNLSQNMILDDLDKDCFIEVTELPDEVQTVVEEVKVPNENN